MCRRVLVENHQQKSNKSSIRQVVVEYFGNLCFFHVNHSINDDEYQANEDGYNVVNFEQTLIVRLHQCLCI